MASPADGPAPDPLTDPRLTAIGLLFEVNAGLREVVDRHLETAGTSGSAFEVLVRLARSPDHRLRMSELAAQSTLTNSGLTRLVDRLQSSGLVRREPCETDRRGYYAVLTDQGLGTVTAVLPAHLAIVEEHLTGVLGVDELDALLGALRRVRAVVKPGSDPVVAARQP
jgi:MarR family transcriptional regulator, 2-MHQ and catechol-resistance regulon repressor